MADEAYNSNGSSNDAVLVVSMLWNVGCCQRCILRFLGEKDVYLYQEPTQAIISKFAGQTGIDTTSIGNKEKSLSVNKLCPFCLGILEKSQQGVYIHKIQSSVQDAGYEFDNFVFNISLPLSIMLRQHSVSIFLQEEFRLVFGWANMEDIPTVKDVFKWVYGPLVEKSLQVHYKPLGPFRISLTFTHEDNDKELNFLNEMSESKPCQRRKRRRVQNPPEGALTAPALKKALKKLTTSDILKRHAKCPPESPQSPADLSEEKICDLIKSKLKAVDHKFASAGREDIDVRMLGIGRPFLVEFINPRVTRLSESSLFKLQQEINSSSEDIAVRDLQQVTKEQTLVLKDAETNKTKTYRALVWTEKKMTKQDLETLQEKLNLTIFQRTPLRVLHRRPMAVRERVIYNMKPDWIDPNYFNLRLTTQAGTYIKEFVHGDFGRTKPSLGNLLNTDADILKLDVESVDVNWPPRKEEPRTEIDDGS